MKPVFKVGALVEILSGPFAGFEGFVTAGPRLFNLYSYTVQVNGYEVHGLRRNQLGAAVLEKEFRPPIQYPENISDAIEEANTLDLPAGALMAQFDGDEGGTD